MKKRRFPLRCNITIFNSLFIYSINNNEEYIYIRKKVMDAYDPEPGPRGPGPVLVSWCRLLEELEQQYNILLNIVNKSLYINIDMRRQHFMADLIMST